MSEVTQPVDEPVVEEPVEVPEPEVVEPEEFDKDRAMALINKLRPFEKQAEAATKKAADLEARLKELEDRDKSEEEKRAERLAALESQTAADQIELQTLRLKTAVYAVAPTVGVADADLALAALDRSLVEYDTQGVPTNITDVLTQLVEQKPILKGQAVSVVNINAGGGAQNGQRPNLTADELEMARRQGLTAEEYAAFKGVTTVDDLHEAERLMATSTQ